MIDKAEQLKDASATGHLVLVEFYASWSPHYEWLEPTVERYAKQVSKKIIVIKVDIGTDKALADSHNIGSVPAFLLLLRGRELWRQVGELTVDELQEVLDEF